MVTRLREVVESDTAPAAAHVTALTTLARHLGTLTDKHEVTGELEVRRLIVVDPYEPPDQIVHQLPQLPPADMDSVAGRVSEPPAMTLSILVPGRLTNRLALRTRYLLREWSSGRVIQPSMWYSS